MPDYYTIEKGMMLKEGQDFIEELSDELNLPLEKDPIDNLYITDHINKYFENEFREATRKILNYFGVDTSYQELDEQFYKNLNEKRYLYHTIYGKRFISDLLLKYDGPEHPSINHIGIPLTQRYYPSVLDFRSTGGCLYQDGPISENLEKYYEYIDSVLNAIHPKFSELKIQTFLCFA